MTDCPTCGCPVTIEGKTTKYYQPVSIDVIKILIMLYNYPANNYLSILDVCTKLDKSGKLYHSVLEGARHDKSS